MDFSYKLLVLVAVIRPCKKEGEIQEGEDEEGCRKIHELFVYVVGIAVRFNVVGFEIQSHGN